MKPSIDVQEIYKTSKVSFCSIRRLINILRNMPQHYIYLYTIGNQFGDQQMVVEREREREIK